MVFFFTSSCFFRRFSNRALISDTLVKNCYALLDDNPQGFWLTDLEVKYEVSME